MKRLYSWLKIKIKRYDRIKAVNDRLERLEHTLVAYEDLYIYNIADLRAKQDELKKRIATLETRVNFIY